MNEGAPKNNREAKPRQEKTDTISIAGKEAIETALSEEVNKTVTRGREVRARAEEYTQDLSQKQVSLNIAAAEEEIRRRRPESNPASTETETNPLKKVYRTMSPTELEGVVDALKIEKNKRKISSAEKKEVKAKRKEESAYTEKTVKAQEETGRRIAQMRDKYGAQKWMDMINDSAAILKKEVAHAQVAEIESLLKTYAAKQKGEPPMTISGHFDAVTNTRAASVPHTQPLQNVIRQNAAQNPLRRIIQFFTGKLEAANDNGVGASEHKERYPSKFFEVTREAQLKRKMKLEQAAAARNALPMLGALSARVKKIHRPALATLTAVFLNAAHADLTDPEHLHKDLKETTAQSGSGEQSNQTSSFGDRFYVNTANAADSSLTIKRVKTTPVRPALKSEIVEAKTHPPEVKEEKEASPALAMETEQTIGATGLSNHKIETKKDSIQEKIFGKPIVVKAPIHSSEGLWGIVRTYLTTPDMSKREVNEAVKTYEQELLTQYSKKERKAMGFKKGGDINHIEPGWELRLPEPGERSNKYYA